MELVKEWGINDHTAFVEKLEASELFKDSLTDEQVQNLATYFFELLTADATVVDLYQHLPKL